MTQYRLLELRETIRSYERAATDLTYRRKLSKIQKIDHGTDAEIVIHYSRHAETLRRCLDFYKNSIGGSATELLVAETTLSSTRIDASIVQIAKPK